MEHDLKTKRKSAPLKQLVYEDEKVKSYPVTIQTFKNEDFTTMNLPSNKDLVPGQYEGGIKVWECSLDLCNFLPEYIGWYELKNLKILELGCGHGLPGVYFLLRNCYVMFQDFNQEVMDKITSTYVNQLTSNYGLDLTKNVAYMNGDWKDFTAKINSQDYISANKEAFADGKFDMIVSADTLYNIENYDSFYNVINTHLKNPGICFISSKKFYFGVGGGTSQFIEYVKAKGDFEITSVKEINDKISNIRQILEIRQKN